jgi:hypothetical protein
LLNPLSQANWQAKSDERLSDVSSREHLGFLLMAESRWLRVESY